MVSPIKNNPFDADEHLLHFAEFVEGVDRTGGATPHMHMAVEAARRRKNVMEKLWIGGCYAFVYNIPTAEVIWKNWEYGSWKNEKELSDWARANWKGLKFRKERKAARSPEHLATCMDTYYKFMQKIPTRTWFHNGDEFSVQYELAFQDLCDNVKYMGRYIAIRWVEFMRYTFNLPLYMPHIHPKDGEHPRKALALMYPEYHDQLMHGNDPETLDVCNQVVEFCRADLHNYYGIDPDYYTLQSLLCEYKQSALAGKQYPGKSIDTELKYFASLEEYWGDYNTEFWDIRKTIFPKFALGEYNGWTGVREELGEVLRSYGYTWSDCKYDYLATVRSEDFSNPVKRKRRHEN